VEEAGPPKREPGYESGFIPEKRRPQESLSGTKKTPQVPEGLMVTWRGISYSSGESYFSPLAIEIH